MMSGTVEPNICCRFIEHKEAGLRHPSSICMRHLELNVTSTDLHDRSSTKYISKSILSKHICHAGCGHEQIAASCGSADRSW